ncbi:MAG TPA: electron transfer flavoprotein subunit alpha/FixB family protein [Syntrophomonadaceae bacterium]|nr:electron transfer flavoprotein subunit alpha/FixB family protein [Syntrophomonadaceae bacterium]HPR93374.1 electron transfer flavoprotein subunit alpha/FixB family protein [Syntrophomonadaceae bacterium]
MTAILIYSDHDGFALELLTAAREMGAEQVRAVTINNDDQAKVLADAGASVLKINNDSMVLADIAATAAAVAQAAEKAGADTILLSSNRRGKELAGRLAQLIGAGCLTDVSSFKYEDGQIKCQRNALGGATVAVQIIKTAKKVIAFMPRSFEAASGSGGSIEEFAADIPAPAVKLVEVKQKSGDNVDIEAAEALVAVGQGLKDADQLPMIEALAKKLGGEVACTKPVATDKKWLSEERIIGLSGKKCKPRLAVLLGISGQVQFTVGIRDAKTIVSINTDENASINTMADYVLVADLHQAVADLNAKL